jgi:hypothetical protein
MSRRELARDDGRTMTDVREELRASIRRDEARLRDAVEDLEVSVSRSLDLASRVAERPYAWLIGALALGFWRGIHRS